MTPQCLSAVEAATAPPLHLVEEIGHRVINEYTEAIASLSLAARACSSPHAHAAIADASERLRAHAAAHRALLPPRDRDIINLEIYLQQVCQSLSNSSFAQRGVQVTLRASSVWLVSSQAWRVGLIVAELLRNAARHGFSGGAGAIAVCLSHRAGMLHCSVVDNGRANPNASPGRGRELLLTMAHELGGTIHWCLSPAGSIATLQVPVTEHLA